MHKHLETLGLPDDASWRDIRHRYRVLSLLNHPDQGGDVEKFVEIKTAYEALRAVYEHEPTQLAKREPVPPKRPRSRRPRWQLRPVWHRLVLVGGLIGVVLSATRLDPVLGPAKPKVEAQVNYAAASCPVGQAVVSLASAREQPDGAGGTRLTVAGRIFNASNAAMEVDQLGFYAGGFSPQRPPDWLADPYQMSTSGNFNDIPAGATIAFTDTEPVSVNQASSDVAIVAAFPRDSGLPVEHTWSWLHTDPSCQPL